MEKNKQGYFLNNINWRKFKILSQRRTRLFTNYLKIRFEKPYTLFLAALFPFLQAFLASFITILTNSENTFLVNFYLFGVSALYYFSFAMNAKRATKGSWIGLAFLIIFGSLGIVCGKLLVLYLNL